MRGFLFGEGLLFAFNIVAVLRCVTLPLNPPPVRGTYHKRGVWVSKSSYHICKAFSRGIILPLK